MTMLDGAIAACCNSDAVLSTANFNAALARKYEDGRKTGHRLERFQAKWVPVRVKNKEKNLEPRLISIKAGALGSF